MLYLSWSPLLFLCTVVVSFDFDAYSISRKAQGDEYDDTGFNLDICIGLFGYLQSLEASLLYRLCFIAIQGRVKIADEFSEAFRCGCEAMLA